MSVFCFDTIRLTDEKAYRTAYNSAPEERRQKVDVLQKFEDKRRSLGAYIAFRAGCRALKMLPEDIRLKYDSVGKPIAEGTGGLYVSITHSGDFALCAFAKKPVGVDIELVEKQDYSFLKRAFSDEENAYLGKYGNKARLFLDTWTRKESLVKAVGRGMFQDPKFFSVVAAGGSKTYIRFQNKEYRFTELTFNPAYCGAVCLETETAFMCKVIQIKEWE